MTGRPPWRDVAIWRVKQRENLGLTRAVVAARLGISVARMAYLETGKNRPNEIMARAWEQALWREAP